MQRRKGNKTVRISDQAVDVLNQLCARFNLTQTQVVDAAIHQAAAEFRNAASIPVPALVAGRDAVGRDKTTVRVKK